MSALRRMPIAAFLMALALTMLVVACGDDVNDPASTPPSTSDGSTATGTTPSSSLTASTGPPAGAVSIDELLTSGDALVGTEIEIVGRAFFLASCPPPSTAGSAPCVLTLYLADPDRNDLLYGERNEAILISEDGRLVSCQEGTDPGGGCPGWDHGVRYSLVGTVQFLMAGDRQTTQITLDVTNKQGE